MSYLKSSIHYKRKRFIGSSLIILLIFCQHISAHEEKVKSIKSEENDDELLVVEEEGSGDIDTNSFNANNKNVNVQPEPEDDAQFSRSHKNNDSDTDTGGPLFLPIKESIWENEKGPQESSSEKQSSKRPNIILILTDDQDIELGSMEYMPETLKVFRRNGIEFRHGYVTTPMCCPSRSSMLTGMYVHNHNVYTNNDNCSSIYWRENFEKKTFASHLKTSGYYTSYIGKYLNKYDGSHIPFGWDEWNTLLMNSKFYNYTVNRNGKNVRYGHNYETDYYPDIITNDTADFLKRMGAGERKVKNLDSNTPFLLVISFPSPHGPEDSAPQYSHLFFNETLHHTPAYNFAPNPDKQWILRVTPKLNSNLKDYTNVLNAKRLQTLQSVDVAVKNIFDVLKTSGLIDNTYVFYTSDHGFHVGQYGLIKGKAMPFEFDIRVPFFLTTPKDLVKGGTMILEPVLNIDLAPTFLDLARVKIPDDMDGRSMVPLIRKYTQNTPMDSAFSWIDTFLIESSGRREPMTEHAIKAQKLRQEQSSNKSDGADVTDFDVKQLNELCSLYPHPCLAGQKKFCRNDNGRIRFRKCKHFTADEGDIMEDHQRDGEYSTGNSTNVCICPGKYPLVDQGGDYRIKRDTSGATTYQLDYDWDVQRKEIDDQIEALKLQIDQLRERRREIRKQWMTARANFLKSESSDSVLEPTRPIKKPGHIQITILQPPTRQPITTTLEQIDQVAPPTIKYKELTGEYDNNPHHVGLDESEFEHRILTVLENFDEETEDDEMDEEIDLDHLIEPETRSGSNTNHRRKGNKKHNHHRNRTTNHNLPKDIDEITDGKETTILTNPEEEESCDCTGKISDPKILKQREKDERRRRKLMGKLRKKQKFLNRINDPDERHQAETCGQEDKMNCFWHDKDHWRTAPFWTGESFCFCMNANNNTFSCLRSINSTHNYIYCHFITGFKMYFNLRQDPYELRNMVSSLPNPVEKWMMDELQRLKECSGHVKCGRQLEFSRPNTRSDNGKSLSEDGQSQNESLQTTIWEKIFGTWRRKKTRNGRKRKAH